VAFCGKKKRSRAFMRRDRYHQLLFVNNVTRDKQGHRRKGWHCHQRHYEVQLTCCRSKKCSLTPISFKIFAGFSQPTHYSIAFFERQDRFLMTQLKKATEDTEILRFLERRICEICGFFSGLLMTQLKKTQRAVKFLRLPICLGKAT